MNEMIPLSPSYLKRIHYIIYVVFQHGVERRHDTCDYIRSLFIFVIYYQCLHVSVVSDVCICVDAY
jgi:hypothetical protein